MSSPTGAIPAARTPQRAFRVLIGGVGYRNLRDHSVGVAVTDRLVTRDWRAPAAEQPLHEVVVEDLSYSPIAVVWRLEDEPATCRFQRTVLVSGVSRGGARMPGTITAYRWDRVLPPPEEVQRAVCDAVTGVIFLDNTLVVARHFGALPDDVIVVEVEPLAHEFGDTFSAPVAGIFDQVCDLVATLATDDRAAARLPCMPLGGEMAARAEAR